MMKADLTMVTIAFSKLHSRAMGFDVGRETGIRLTGPEAACKWTGIVNAVNRLPVPTKTYAHFAYVDGGVKMDQAGGVVRHVLQNMDWIDPSQWTEDSETGWRKVAVTNYVVRDIYRRRGIASSDLGRLAQLPSQYFAPSKPWGRFKSAIDAVFEQWDREILDAVESALDRRAA